MILECFWYKRKEATSGEDPISWWITLKVIIVSIEVPLIRIYLRRFWSSYDLQKRPKDYFDTLQSGKDQLRYYYTSYYFIKDISAHCICVVNLLTWIFSAL